jgi:hypothetical protein
MDALSVDGGVAPKCRDVVQVRRDVPLQKRHALSTCRDALTVCEDIVSEHGGVLSERRRLVSAREGVRLEHQDVVLEERRDRRRRPAGCLGMARRRLRTRTERL